jgi:RimJ/RimL family protein N-acetyltransferase
MNTKALPAADVFARGNHVTIRHIESADLDQISGFAFTVSITEPLSELASLTRAFDASGFWAITAGAVAIVDSNDGRLLGTAQFYRSAPCIHGYELGYIIHNAADRGRGAASEAVKLFSDYLFETNPDFYRLQLIIEAWNVASWKLAERCGFVREGLLRSAGFGAADPADCFIYCRTRKDWHEARHSPISMGGSLPSVCG